MLNFAEEVYASLMTPVWGFVRKNGKGGAA